MTVLHTLLKSAQAAGIPLGRWPDSSSLAFHLRRLVDRYKIDLTLDVGAHQGEYVNLMRHSVRYRGDIISFEPAAKAFAALEASSARDPHWRVERVALSDESGVKRLQHYHHSTLNSLRMPSQFGGEMGHLRAGNSEQVSVARLDELDLSLDNYSSRLLKIDTQGFDLQVLRGAAGILDRVIALQIEVPMLPLYEGAADFPTMISAVQTLGFSVSGLFPIVHDSLLRAVEFDCVAVRSPHVRDIDPKTD